MYNSSAGIFVRCVRTLKVLRNAQWLCIGCGFEGKQNCIYSIPKQWMKWYCNDKGEDTTSKNGVHVTPRLISTWPLEKSFGIRQEAKSIALLYKVLCLFHRNQQFCVERSLFLSMSSDLEIKSRNETCSITCYGKSSMPLHKSAICRWGRMPLAIAK